MTIDDYISRTKVLVPVHPGRFSDAIKLAFNKLVRSDFFIEEHIKVDFRIISSTSLFSEVVYTKPNITLLWDNYQFELIEKFFISSLSALNHNEWLANLVLKMNINAAISLRLSNISPELSYVFASHYRMQFQELNHDNIILVSDTLFDLLYSQLIFLGHEVSHIILGHESKKELFQILEDDFTYVMKGIMNVIGDNKPFDGSKTYSDLYKLLMKPENTEYRTELFCDIFAYDLVGNLVEGINKKISPNRKIEELYDDLFNTHKSEMMFLDSFLYILEFWTKVGMKSSMVRKIKKEHLSQPSPNFSVWDSRFYGREHLLFLYLQTKLFRQRDIVIPNNNQKALSMYLEFHNSIIKLLENQDTEWLVILDEANKLYAKNINPKDLIRERDILLFS